MKLFNANDMETITIYVKNTFVLNYPVFSYQKVRKR